jgi:hypothetical protein
VKLALSSLVVACGVAVAAAGSASALAAGGASPKVTVLPTQTIGSTEPTPEAPAAARREAYAARAQAERDCRSESSADARQGCMAAAQEDFRNTMARARTGS